MVEPLRPKEILFALPNLTTPAPTVATLSAIPVKLVCEYEAVRVLALYPKVMLFAF
jgi:hypothetical protein